MYAAAKCLFLNLNPAILAHFLLSSLVLIYVAEILVSKNYPQFEFHVPNTVKRKLPKLEGFHSWIINTTFCNRKTRRKIFCAFPRDNF